MVCVRKKLISCLNSNISIRDTAPKNYMIQPNEEAKQDINCKDNIEIDANKFLTEEGLDVDNEVSQRLIGKV